MGQQCGGCFCAADAPDAQMSFQIVDANPPLPCAGRADVKATLLHIPHNQNERLVRLDMQSRSSPHDPMNHRSASRRIDGESLVETPRQGSHTWIRSNHETTVSVRCIRSNSAAGDGSLSSESVEGSPGVPTTEFKPIGVFASVFTQHGGDNLLDVYNVSELSYCQ